MLTGKRFWTLALIFGLCVLATAGCRRKKSSRTTINNAGVFTTDDFPGASVQDNNVADDKRAFSASTDDYDGNLVCTHNGDRGTMMVTYEVDDQIFAHYWDGSQWTRGVSLRHFDTFIGSGDAGEIVHAFVNTANDDRADAEDRDGDCLIFWAADDFDTDGGAGGDESNHCLYVSYFDVSHYTEADLNYGFDIDPANPGFYYAQRVSSLEFSGEDVQFQGLVTDGLCGEARWQDGANVYSYGDDTSAIFVFYHQQEEKSGGVFDETTQTAGFDLDLVVDEEFPLTPTSDVEIAIQTFGASDSGIDSQESCVGTEYSSYNDILMFLVRSYDGSGTTSFAPLDWANFPGTDVDITMQYTFFNFGTFTLTTDCVNTYDPNSTAVAGVDDMNSDFQRIWNVGFLGSTGMFAYGRDEGLSCFVTFFGEMSDPNNTAGLGWLTEDSEPELVIAEIDEDTGAFLNDAEASILDVDDGTFDDFNDNRFSSTAISRNGDYIWIQYLKRNQLGTSDDYSPEFVQYLTTRLDGDGNPVAIPLLTTTLGLPFQWDVEDGSFSIWLWQWQDNLGYQCGIQSDAQQMAFFWSVPDTGTGNSLWYMTWLTADVDGTVGGESMTTPGVLIDEDVGGYHLFMQGLNLGHMTFNATDAGQDGDIVYVFTWDENDINGLSDTYISMGRAGVTAAAPIVIGSGIGERHVAYGGQELMLVATPPGTDIAGWDVDNSQYDSQAHHGAEFVHVIFREAETSSVPFVGSNTETGWALRTRTYDTDLGGGTFGDDFTPSAGTAFRKPFDLDLPFMDPDDWDDAEVMDVLVCDNTVVLIFTEAGHVYYQECNPGDGGDDDQPGWRQEAAGVSDPALVDDDTTELLEYFEEVCSPSCVCCDIDGSAIFWVKNLDDGSSIDRLQVRVIDTGGN